MTDTQKNELPEDVEKRIDRANFHVYGPLGMGVDTNKLKQFIAKELAQAYAKGKADERGKIEKVLVRHDEQRKPDQR
jgi:hypothetical protein